MSNEELLEKMQDPWWRLNNLYYIVDKRGRKVLFKPNWAQKQLYEESWYCNIILKARQIGISTYVCILFTDRALFNPNIACGIICHTREDSEHMFKRVKYAYDMLPLFVRENRLATSDSARELIFSNGSSIRVGTSMRGSTLQYLHISEFGKICSKYIDKAQEIITGSLNAIAEGQYVFIESTAEGREGYFYDMCKKAQDDKKMDRKLSKLDFKFHFFPWHGERNYRIGNEIFMNQDSLDYFESLESRGVKLEIEQKWWYAARSATMQEDMLKEYPSTPDEAWEQSNEGLYYGKLISLARLEGRIGFIPYDDELLVHTSWDIGYNDSNAIWYFQVVGKEIRLIDYDEGSGESLAHWLGVVKSKHYTYGTHLAPHDIQVTEYATGISRLTTARKMGINFIPVPKSAINEGIDAVRNILTRCFFSATKCEVGIKCLDSYRKEWDDKHGCWTSRPRHDSFSHGADAFRYLASGLHFITNHSNKEFTSIGRGSIINQTFPSTFR